MSLLVYYLHNRIPSIRGKPIIFQTVVIIIIMFNNEHNDTICRLLNHFCSS